MTITINRTDIVNKLKEDDTQFDFEVHFPIEGKQLKEYAVGLAEIVLLSMEDNNLMEPDFIPAEDFLDLTDGSIAELVKLNEDFIFTEDGEFSAAHSLREAREKTEAAIESSVRDTIVWTVADAIAELYGIDLEVDTFYGRLTW